MALRSITRIFLNPVFRTTRTISPSILRPFPRLPRTSQPVARRFAHAIPKPSSRTPEVSASSSPSEPEAKPRKLLEPHYELTFTCVPCGGRSTHAISKQGYHKGSVLITCPSCRNRHVISDHLDIFGNRKITVEDLMREKGQLVKRGTLGEAGDVEFWEDGTVTERGADGANGSSDQADVRSELNALPEEEEATRLREARDPSSQSTEPTPSASTPLGIPTTRPSVDRTRQTKHVPSTRRSFSTTAQSNIRSSHALLAKKKGKRRAGRRGGAKRKTPRAKSEYIERRLILTRNQRPKDSSPPAQTAPEPENAPPPLLKGGNNKINYTNDILPRIRVLADGQSFAGVRYHRAKPKKLPPEFLVRRILRKALTHKNVVELKPAPRVVSRRRRHNEPVDDRPWYVRTGLVNLFNETDHQKDNAETKG
ncbi:DNL zinc finger-domain-containing protein [Hypoxylon crocopeplum]|nr:DNL zinc finger-domain-containing protein [Hypoxylon crocopeplum]